MQLPEAQSSPQVKLSVDKYLDFWHFVHKLAASLQNKQLATSAFDTHKNEGVPHLSILIYFN